MKRRVFAIFAVVAVATGFDVSVAAAQFFTPSYMAPRQSSDVGIYLAEGPGDFAIEGIWRRVFGGYDLGLRAGVADVNDVAFLAAAELRNPLSTTAPIDLAFTAGAQALLTDDDSGGAIGVGLTIGYTFEEPDLAITPYLHPRAAAVVGFGDTDLELLADIGFDVRFGSNLELRFSIGLGDITSDFGIGLAWR